MRLAVLPLILAAGLLGAAERAPAPKAAGPVTFAEIATAALADAQALPAEVAARTRYLSAAHLPREERRELYAVVSYHVNGLSRESKRVPPRKVTERLWAVDLSDYRWSAAVWDDLKRVNHYFVLKVQQVAVAQKQVTKAVTDKVKKQRQVLRYDQYGRGSYVTEDYYEDVTREVVETVAEPGATKEDFVAAPWLPPKEMAQLVARTGSVTPIVRADEFLFQTGAQADRKGHGYYDWLALTKRADAEQLAALDRKKAEDLYRELAAIIPVSGVSPNNRQVFRYATLTGSWWESRDVFNNRDRKNAVSHLLGDYEYDAEEIVFTLPNGLPGYYLSDAKGVQQDTAPDTIASDHRSTNNDRRVHVGMSCVTCHQDGGLKPVRDYARRLYSPEAGVSLATVALDPARAKRLESVYLGPLEKAYKRDAGDFAEAIEEVSGLRPAALAKGYERAWSRYLDEPVTLEKAAAECGVAPEVLRAKLRTYARAKGVIDPVLVGLVVDDPPPLRREHFEERFPVLMLVLGGAAP
ncbi:MAG: hypothetical protein E6Q76_19665 [Rhizobium sp.]|nr:MAG: hypothetical protein E6Q76_19665 [Rhizobium sp.]